MKANKNIQFSDFELNYSAALPANKKAMILDFGCGNGRAIRFLINKGYENITGVDIVSNEWDELADKQVTLIKINNAKEYLQAQKEKFDFIIAKDVIYYFDANETIEITKLLKNSLKPGGTIIFEIFNGSTFTGPYVKYKDLGIKLILTELSLQHIIFEAGLKLLSVYGNRQRKKSFKAFIFFLLNKIWRWRLKIIYFLERGRDEQNPKIFARKVIAVAQKIMTEHG